MAASRFGWTFALTSLAWFVFALDRLVVTTALPLIRADLGADLAGTEWAVNAYTLTFAVLLLTGAALGDRFGRRRMFAAGSRSSRWVGRGRARPDGRGAGGGAGGSGRGRGGLRPVGHDDVDRGHPAGAARCGAGRVGRDRGARRRGRSALGRGVTVWAGWPWIFWLNVPLGRGTRRARARCLVESRGPHRRIDVPGVVLGSAGCSGWCGGWSRRAPKVGRLRTC